MWNHSLCPYIWPSVHMSVCHPLCVSNFVLTISPELLNHFEPNLIWWCIITWQSIRQKKTGSLLQCQGHREGLYNQNVTISTISSKLLVRLQPNLVWYYSTYARVSFGKNWITSFKVKVSAKVKNVHEYLSGYLLNHKIFCYRTWHNDAAK